ncbi:MAG: accessory gene regulator B family protein [Oscillospiraceae bacterium]|nr:accessory gene regulator B family protein [Oscillospiraceae bacterium]
MLQQLSLKIANQMVSDQIIHEGQIPVYKYGLELVLSSIAGILALVIVSFIGGEPFWWMSYLVGFVPMRLTGGGYHAGSHRSCIALFTVFYAINLFIFNFFIIPKGTWVIICAVNVLILYIFSPVEAKNKPLHVVKRKKNRKRSLLLGMLNLSVAVGLLILQNSIPSWLILYFAGSTMACVSIMLAVVINTFRKERQS